MKIFFLNIYKTNDLKVKTFKLPLSVRMMRENLRNSVLEIGRETTIGRSSYHVAIKIIIIFSFLTVLN